MAGGWVSGGGEILKDSGNPWFIENTKEVKWCVLHNPQHFNRDKKSLINLVNTAIDGWQLDIKRAGSLVMPGGTPKIGTQKFIYQDKCAAETDIRFQFGVLTGKQIEKIGDPTKYLALSRRTSYDQKLLRGKGFFYFSADSGPLKFSGNHIIENPWGIKNGIFLFLALNHELGHLFGVPHSQTFSMHDLMSKGFLSYALSKQYHNRVANQYRLLKNFPSHFDVSERAFVQTACYPIQFPQKLYHFFNIRSDKKCLHLYVKNNKLTLLSGDNEYDFNQKIKVINMKKTNVENLSSVYLFVTGDQSLFGFNQAFPYLPIGTSKIAISYEGDLQTSTGSRTFNLEVDKERPLLLRGLISEKLVILNQLEHVGN